MQWCSHPASINHCVHPTARSQFTQVLKVYAAVPANAQALGCCICSSARHLLLRPPLPPLLLLLAALRTSQLAPTSTLPSHTLGPYALSVAETFLHTPGAPPITFSAKLVSTFTELSGVQV